MARHAKNPIYVALTGDLVASRNLSPKDRAELQQNVLTILAALNGSLGAETLAAPLTLTAGDEIQGLFRDSERLVEVIQELTDRLFGVTRFPYIVFGAGRGSLTTGPIPSSPQMAPTPAYLDGPAFHFARAAVEAASRDKAWARFRGFGPSEDELLDALFTLMGAVRSRWSGEQGVNSYLARGYERQKDLAAHRVVSPSVVSESLKAAHHKELLAGERAARLVLAGLRSGAGDG